MEFAKYNLDERTIQNRGTHQCWWLSFLEILRATGRLDDLYKVGGILDVGEIPADDGNLVYGPNWQKVIMNYLRGQKWIYQPNDTVNTSDRKNELYALLRILGITGVTIHNGVSLGFNVKEKLKGFANGTILQVDKPNHAMSGTVGVQDKVKGIQVYNQQTQAEIFYSINKDGKLSSPSGKSVLNYCFEIT